jgi:hypothetical protein
MPSKCADALSRFNDARSRANSGAKTLYLLEAATTNNSGWGIVYSCRNQDRTAEMIHLRPCSHFWRSIAIVKVLGVGIAGVHRRAILVFGGWSRWQRLQLELCMGDIDVNNIGREKSGGNKSLKPS